MPITKIKPALKQLINKWNLIGAEVGVYDGDHASFYLADLDIKLVFLIDSYSAYKGFDPINFGLRDLKESERIAHHKLKKYNNKIKWLKMKSTDAVKFIPDNSLDFVYIDADHSYNSVIEDILLFYPKLKNGALLSGHDYDYEQVEEAVNEFIRKNNLILFIKNMEPGQFAGKNIKYDWWTWKENVNNKNC